MNFLLMIVSLSVFTTNIVPTPANDYDLPHQVSVMFPKKRGALRCSNYFNGTWHGIKKDAPPHTYVLYIEVVQSSGPLIQGRIMNDEPGFEHIFSVRIKQLDDHNNWEFFCEDDKPIVANGFIQRIEHNCKTIMDVRLEIDVPRKHIKQKVNGTDGTCKMDKGYTEEIFYYKQK